MAKQIISHLPVVDVMTFLYEMPPVQAETVLGGDTIVDLSTVHDGINNLSNTFPSLFGIEGNKLFTLDFSRLTMNMVMMMPDIEALLLRLMG